MQAMAIDKFYARFDAALTDRGGLAMGGQIIDATVGPPQVAQHRGREGRDRARQGAGALEREARQRQPERSRCELEPGVQKGQGEGGCRPQGLRAGRSCHPDVRLQEPHRYRSGQLADPHLDASEGNAHNCAQLPELISKQHWLRRMGRRGL